MESMLYSLDEVTLIPSSKLTIINSRSECDIYRGGKLPIFVSPMSCVIDMNNAQLFENSNLNVIYPRTIPWESRVNLLTKEKWVAFGFKETQMLYHIWEADMKYGKKLDFKPHILIDQANGHMSSLYDLCRDIKELLGDNVVLMVGNVANPDIYFKYSSIGVDYVRVSVGTGNACTTSSQTGFHYPMASLLINIKEDKKFYKHDKFPKIIADGGMIYNSQIIKALALGADYVMLGKAMAMCEEACGESIWDISSTSYIREYYGMSTHKAQNLIHNCSGIQNDNFIEKREEGISDYVKISYSIKDWVDWFENDLRSAMSYAGYKKLNEFIGEVDYSYISPQTNYQIMKKIY